MILVLAGKSNALIKCLNFSLNFFNKDSIKIIPAHSDTSDDTWSYSISKYCRRNEFETCNLEDVYEIEDLLFVSIQYDKIIDTSKFKSKKIYNIHFSYLPFYKGMYPIVWPIINQEEFSGVTLHELDWGIDTGDIIDQKKILLNDSMTSRQLYEKCINAAVELFEKNVKLLITSTYEKEQQPRLIGSYYSKKSIDFANINLNLNKTAAEVSAQIRSFIFPEFQYPIFDGFEINRVEILSERSLGKPGKVHESNSGYLVVQTVDYNIKLFKSFERGLFSAIESNNLDFILEKIEFFQNLDFRNNKDWTPLMMAAFLGRSEMVKILAENGANVNAKNFKGTSVLMYAKSSASKTDDLEILKYLISKGALVDDKDDGGQSLINYAIEEGNSQVINFLKSNSVLK